MGKEKSHNIFISHHHKDVEDLNKFKDLLTRNNLGFKDSSIDGSKPNNAKNPDYIKSLIRPKIDWAGTTIVLVGPETHQREWVDWEIEYAQKNDKRIVGVFVQGGKDNDIPDNLKKYGDALVGWNAEKIIDAINGENIWLTPDGKNHPGLWKIDRSNC